MKPAHIVAEYALRTIDDIGTMVGSVSFAKSTHNALITASIHAASWLLVAIIRSAKQDDNYGTSNIVLPCPGS
jgi:hypothetical protein